MPDEKPTPEAKPKVDDWKAPANQEELDKIIEARLARERKNFADYDALKAKADEFDKAQDASKTELQLATELATKAQAEVAAIRIESDRNAVALELGLTPTQAKRLVGTTRDELKADATELLADLSAVTPAAPPKPPGGSGAAPQGGGDGSSADRQLARELFGAHN